MKKARWEYKSVYYGVHELPMRNHADYLNKQGNEGWELVQIIIERMINEPWQHANYTFYFKRALG